MMFYVMVAAVPVGLILHLLLELTSVPMPCWYVLAFWGVCLVGMLAELLRSQSNESFS
ncbi:MAG: hypothetical protein AAFX06_19980 [Planctomycetota bacterium]